MDNEKLALAKLAIGRILRLCSRSEQPGDVAEYERCRKIVLDAAEDDHDGLLATQDLKSRAPLPGWNFGCGSTGCIE